ncbi:hypothetical protein Hanom_Chr00s078083g01792231 [Helianthus anomalus]
MKLLVVHRLRMRSFCIASWLLDLNALERLTLFKTKLYEHAMLLDLLKKGHLEAEKKIGAGIKTFQVRYHPQWKSRCFFLVREDESADDFSFRKCVDHILPLPENMTVKYDFNKESGGGRGGRGGGRSGGRGNWRGRGRGGKPKN